MANWRERKRRPERRVVLQERDLEIFEFLYDMDGLSSLDQLRARFVVGSPVAFDRRLWRLYDNRYLNRISRELSKDFSDGRVVYWLGKRGYNRLTEKGTVMNPLDYRRARVPVRYRDLRHTLKTNGIRLAVYQALDAHPRLQLMRQATDRDFSRTKRANNKLTYINKARVEVTKEVRPDAFHIIAAQNEDSAQPDIYGLLWEIDNSTHPHNRFFDDKVRGGLAFLKSHKLRALMEGQEYARWYVVCKTKERMQNLRVTAQAAGAKQNFLFSTFDLVAEAPEAILTAPIWYFSDRPRPVRIIGHQESK